MQLILHPANHASVRRSMTNSIANTFSLQRWSNIAAESPFTEKGDALYLFLLDGVINNTRSHLSILHKLATPAHTVGFLPSFYTGIKRNQVKYTYSQRTRSLRLCVPASSLPPPSPAAANTRLPVYLLTYIIGHFHRCAATCSTILFSRRLSSLKMSMMFLPSVIGTARHDSLFYVSFHLRQHRLSIRN